MVKESTLAGTHTHFIKTLDVPLTTYRKIVDDHYEHALRLYRDRDSGALRLQASVLRGELKRFVYCKLTIQVSY